MPHRISAITLDLDDTLWAVDAVIERAEAVLHAWLEQRAPALAAALPPAKFMAFRRAMAAELPDLAHDFTTLRRLALSRALQMHGEDPALAAPALEVFLQARNEVELYPDAPSALERLSAHYPLAVVTNGNADVERIGIRHYFRAVVSARSAGVAKPDARIFHLACAQLGAAPEQVLHVGDDPELDVQGAHAAGLRPAWVHRGVKVWSGAPSEAPAFHDLDALCRWLEV